MIGRHPQPLLGGAAFQEDSKKLKFALFLIAIDPGAYCLGKVLREPIPLIVACVPDPRPQSFRTNL
ncbi:hypothetical protein ATY77_03065 [Rhizobium sp. R634]|nr:hypothetical protein ATY77_03065 [Rhizobium sp. R634]